MLPVIALAALGVAAASDEQSDEETEERVQILLRVGLLHYESSDEAWMLWNTSKQELIDIQRRLRQGVSADPTVSPLSTWLRESTKKVARVDFDYRASFQVFEDDERFVSRFPETRLSRKGVIVVPELLSDLGVVSELTPHEQSPCGESYISFRLDPPSGRAGRSFRFILWPGDDEWVSVTIKVGDPRAKMRDRTHGKARAAGPTLYDLLDELTDS